LCIPLSDTIVWATVRNVVLSLDVLESISCVVWNRELYTFGLLSVFFVSHSRLYYSVLLHEMADVMCTQFHIYITLHSSKLHRQELGKWFNLESLQILKVNAQLSTLT
jgi:hypothetical protein